MTARNPLKITPAKPMRLYLVRHGHYELDPSSPLYPGPALSPLGRRQARRLAAYLDSVRFDFIYVSTMTRARGTAEPVIRRQPRAKVIYTSDIAEIREGIIAPYPPGAGSGGDRRRVERFAARLASAHRPGETVLAVCHANVIRYFLARAVGAPLKEGARFQTHNTGISVIEYYRTGRIAFTVERINFFGHLPADMVT